MTLLASPRDTALDVRDPATGEVVGTIPAGSPEAADRAVLAARAAQPAWARRPAAGGGPGRRAGGGGAGRGGGGGGGRGRGGGPPPPQGGGGEKPIGDSL